MSPAGFLRGLGTAPSAQLFEQDWREAYNAALPLLTEYGTELSQTVELQRAYAEVSRNLPADASEASRSAVDHALRDFHLAGVDLEESKKERFKVIMQELAEAQANFEHNVQDASDAWTLHITDSDNLLGLPEDEAREVLTSRSFSAQVDEDWARSRQYGITGVPTFVAGGYALVGAQPYEYLERLLGEAGAPRRGVQ